MRPKEISKMDNACELIKISTSFQPVIEQINNLLTIERIDIELVKAPKFTALYDKQHEVKAVIDSKFVYLEKLIDRIYPYLNAYQQFLNNLANNDNLPTSQKIMLSKFALLKFQRMANQYHLSSRFSFIRKNILFTKINNKQYVIPFNNLIIKSKEENALKEIFAIRNEAYAEIVVMTQIFIDTLESELYKDSEFQLTTKGEKLITELILALQADNTFIENKDKEFIYKSISELFGLSGRAFTVNKMNMRKLGKRGRHLNILADILEKARL